MAIEYSPRFQHKEWVDNVDRVRAGGEEGFNQRFNDIEAEFKAIETAVQNIDAAINSRMERIVTSHLEIKNSTGETVISLNKRGIINIDAEFGDIQIQGMAHERDFRNRFNTVANKLEGLSQRVDALEGQIKNMESKHFFRIYDLNPDIQEKLLDDSGSEIFMPGPMRNRDECYILHCVRVDGATDEGASFYRAIKRTDERGETTIIHLTRLDNTDSDVTLFEDTNGDYSVLRITTTYRPRSHDTAPYLVRAEKFF